MKEPYSAGAAAVGLRLRQQRLKRGWSQEGLCRGICAASYLSKIEQGQVQAAPELLELLFRRLELPWYGESLPELEELVERRYECLLDGDKEGFRDSREVFCQALDRLLSSPLAADGLVLDAMDRNDPTEIPPALEPYLDRRQLAILRVVQDRDVEAVRLLPEAYCYLMAGIAGYEQGSDYTGAMALLQQGYDLAARDDRVRLMLECRMFMGSLCCNQLDLGGMETHYQAAERMARALGRQDDLRSMAYNRAASQVECGRYQEAYGYFAALEHPRVMELHKLAVCCEGLGRTREALDALDRAETAPEEYPDWALCMGICGLVRRRLENPGYLRDPDYGAALMDVFNRCRRELPIGYAAFHLPRVLEWLTAGRQYKQAYELLRDFPIKLPNLLIE